MAKIANDEDFLKLLPSKWWVKFFKKFAEIDTLPVSDWKHVHFLAYFSKRFEDHFQKRFSFTIKGRPSSCTEIYQIKQVMAVLGTDKPSVMKAYIDWIFDKKIIPLDKKIRSVGFMQNPQYCNEFNLYWKDKNKVTRSTSLPEDYIDVIKDLDLSIENYGDLAFAKQAIDINPNGREVYLKMFDKLYSVGFEFKELEGILSE